MIYTQQITVNAVCAGPGRSPQKTRRPAKRGSQNEAKPSTHTSFSRPRSFQKQQAEVWVGTNAGRGADLTLLTALCLWACESSEVSTPHPLAAWQFATEPPTCRFPPSPNDGSFRWERRASKPDLHQVLGRPQFRLQCHFLRLRRVAALSWADGLLCSGARLVDWVPYPS